MPSEPRRKVSDGDVYSSFHIPTVSCYGPALLFLTSSQYWTAVKDCVGYSRHMAFPSICGPLDEPVAKQVDSNNPPAHHVAPLHSNGLVMTPLYPKEIQIISKSLLQGWRTHLQLSVITNNMPGCCRHSKRPQIC